MECEDTLYKSCRQLANKYRKYLMKTLGFEKERS